MPPGHRAAVAAFPHTPNVYDAQNEGAFRKSVGDSLLQLANANLQRVEKTLHIPHGEFTPETNATTYTRTRGDIYIPAAASSSFQVGLRIPPGSVLTGLSIRGSLGHANNSVGLAIFRQNEDDTEDAIDAANLSATSLATVAGSGVEEEVRDDASYMAQLVMGFVTVPTPTFRWLKVSYLSFDTTISY